MKKNPNNQISTAKFKNLRFIDRTFILDKEILNFQKKKNNLKFNKHIFNVGKHSQLNYSALTAHSCLVERRIQNQKLMKLEMFL